MGDRLLVSMELCRIGFFETKKIFYRSILSYLTSEIGWYGLCFIFIVAKRKQSTLKEEDNYFNDS